MKKDTNNTQLDGHLVSIRSLSALTGLDRDTIRTSISRAALKPAGTLGGCPAYLLRDALRALFVRHGDVDPATLTPHDRKALADARLREHTLHVKEGNYLQSATVARLPTRWSLRQSNLFPTYVNGKLVQTLKRSN